MKVYLLGGFDCGSGGLSPVDRRCVEEAPNKSVYVVDLTTNDDSKVEAYRQMLRNYFLNVGATAVDFISLSRSSEVRSLLYPIRAVVVPGLVIVS